jgi:lipopolysaccharide/colanic/teichoic acid biosynthesis glycosyltransferase
LHLYSVQWVSIPMKRIFDLVASLFSLVIATPVLLIVAILIKLDSKGPVFFKQWRIGRNGKPFKIHKLRTMVQDADTIGPLITQGNDPRITRIGRILRRYEIDELPTFINVLKGDMSIVGPRPEVPKYLGYYTGKYKKILSVRPGMTDLGTIRFRDEARYLNIKNPEGVYDKEILPQKLEIYLEYLRKKGFFYDLKIIFKTFALVLKQRKV